MTITPGQVYSQSTFQLTNNSTQSQPVEFQELFASRVDAIQTSPDNHKTLEFDLVGDTPLAAASEDTYEDYKLPETEGFLPCHHYNPQLTPT